MPKNENAVACGNDTTNVEARALALALARGDGRYANLLRSLARVDLLVLDDCGPETFNADLT